MGRFWIPKSVEKTCQDFYRPAKAAKSRQAEPGCPLKWCLHGRVSVGQFQPERTGFQALFRLPAGAYLCGHPGCEGKQAHNLVLAVTRDLVGAGHTLQQQLGFEWATSSRTMSWSAH
jgi:hypothetical protein